MEKKQSFGLRKKDLAVIGALLLLAGLSSLLPAA